MIEHDMDVAFDLADRITVLHQGGLIAEGDVAAIRNDPQVTAIYLGADEPNGR
jgi:branched-chain amino acid transport system ATP-binding protein